MDRKLNAEDLKRMFTIPSRSEEDYAEFFKSYGRRVLAIFQEPSVLEMKGTEYQFFCQIIVCPSFDDHYAVQVYK
jgi:hypothetical protein